jgi:hypothetical protein
MVTANVAVIEAERKIAPPAPVAGSTVGLWCWPFMVQHGESRWKPEKDSGIVSE